MSSKIQIVIFLLSLIMIGACKKYPEQKGISLRKPANRLNGNWKIKDYTFNSSSVLDLINSKTKFFDIRDLILEVTKRDGKVLQHYRFNPYSLLNADGYDNPLQDNDTKFRFVSAPNPKRFGDSILNYVFVTPLSFKGQNYTKWNISKLYKCELNLELETDSGKYKIFYEKE